LLSNYELSLFVYLKRWKIKKNMNVS